MRSSAAGAAAPNAEWQDDVSLGELRQTAGFALRIAQLTLFERFFVSEWPRNLRISEFTVLLAMSHNPGVRQGVLADILKIKWPNMTKLVRALEERGLVERRIPKTNRRSVELWITPMGRRLVEDHVEHMQLVDREALSMLSDDEIGQLLTLCSKIAGWDAPASKRSFS